MPSGLGGGAPIQKVCVLAQSGEAVSHTGDTNETTLATITIPAGVLGPNGQVDIESFWSYTNSANNKTFKVKFGGTQISSQVATTTASAQGHARVSNRNDAESQVAFASFGGYTGGSGLAPATAAIDTAATVDITLTATLENSSETITLESYTVKLYPGA